MVSSWKNERELRESHLWFESRWVEKWGWERTGWIQSFRFHLEFHGLKFQIEKLCGKL